MPKLIVCPHDKEVHLDCPVKGLMYSFNGTPVERVPEADGWDPIEWEGFAEPPNLFAWQRLPNAYGPEWAMAIVILNPGQPGGVEAWSGTKSDIEVRAERESVIALTWHGLYATEEAARQWVTWWEAEH